MVAAAALRGRSQNANRVQYCPKPEFTYPILPKARAYPRHGLTQSTGLPKAWDVSEVREAAMNLNSGEWGDD